MRDHLFWLTDDQFAGLEPHLPTDTRGKARVDDQGDTFFAARIGAG